MPSSPKISVVIPVFDGADFLPEAIDSVTKQTQPAHEIIVVDDGSTDTTAEVARGYGSRIRYIHQVNRGLSDARNTGIRAATGDWIALLDSDDLCHPDRLRLTATSIADHPKAVVHYTGFEIFDQVRTQRLMAAFPAVKLWPALRYRTPILPSTATVHRSTVLSVGGFRQRTIEDWDLWFRIMQRCGPEGFQDIQEYLVRYRRWEGSLSSKYVAMSDGMLDLMNDLLLSDLSGISRTTWKRKIEARIHYELSVELRATSDSRFLQHALLSFAKWPLFGKVVPLKRYKVLANMLIRDAMSDLRTGRAPERSA